MQCTCVSIPIFSSRTMTFPHSTLTLLSPPVFKSLLAGEMRARAASVIALFFCHCSKQGSHEGRKRKGKEGRRGEKATSIFHPLYLYLSSSLFSGTKRKEDTARGLGEHRASSSVLSFIHISPLALTLKDRARAGGEEERSKWEGRESPTL